MTGVDIEDLGVSYGEFPVWSNLDLEFGDPGLVCILGPNGVGKSTLLHAINRLQVPSEGRVLIDGDDASKLGRREIARRVAYIPQASDEAFSMSVLDAVLMGRHPVSSFSTKREDLRIAARCLRMLGIEDLARRRFDGLSSGQRQKVMIARGLAQEARIVLLDEPTSNLDLRHQLETMRLLRDVAASEGIVIVAVCHDINLAARYADRIVLLSDGRVKADGTPSDVITRENIRDVYGLECDIADVSGRPYMIYRTDDRGPRRAPG